MDGLLLFTRFPLSSAFGKWYCAGGPELWRQTPAQMFLSSRFVRLEWPFPGEIALGLVQLGLVVSLGFRAFQPTGQPMGQPMG